MSMYGYPQIQITFAGLSWAGAMAPGVNTIHAIDPSFDGSEFLVFAQGAFQRVQDARAEGRLDDVRPLVSETLWPSFKSAHSGKAPKVVSIEHATIYDAHRDAAWDSVTVRFGAKTEGKRNNDLVEDWTFQRPAVTGQQHLPVECPSCGAPLSLDDNGGCRYCRVTVTGARGGWKLVRAVPANLAPKTSRSSGLSWVAAFVIFMVLMTVVLPIAILVVVSRTTSDAFDSFGISGSTNGLDGPSAKSSTNEKVQAPTVPTTRSPAKQSVSGSSTFSGAFTGTLQDGLTTAGATSGACADRARTVNGVTVGSTSRVIDGGGESRRNLALRATLPAGTQGAGTYDLATTPMEITVSLSASQNGGTAQNQVWTVGPTTTATLAVDATDSGTLRVAGLQPTTPKAPGDPLGGQLAVDITFTCS